MTTNATAIMVDYAEYTTVEKRKWQEIIGRPVGIRHRVGRAVLGN
ncbi:hypothetical protein [Sphingobacterium sp. E70]|nr:hypothetical protein [Sphingobacterium sp. E70]